MNSTSVDIKDMLEAISSLGLTLGTNLFIGSEPTTPDNCATIFDTFGGKPDLTLNDKGLENPAVQIRVRNNSYLSGWSVVQGIADTLHARAQEIWNGTLYSVIYISSGPAMLNLDENNRVRFIVNFNIQRRKL